MSSSQNKVIDLQGIRRSFMIGDTETEILHGIDLQIYEGDMLAIMGSSGSGKSTLMNIIGALDRPSAGNYVLNNAEVSSLEDDELADIRNEYIGFVFQQFYLLSRLTAAQNVALPLEYRGVNKKEIEERVMSILTRVGMGDRTHHRPSELSGGQQQRVAIARALVGEPSLILADEPTGALDSKTSDEVMALFLELNQQDGKTLVMVTHDPSVGSRCKRIINLIDGNIDSEKINS